MMGSWLKNTSVGFKVAIAPAVSVLFLLVVGLLGVYANQKLGQALAVLSETRMASMQKVNLLDKRLESLNTLVNQSLAWEGAGFKEDRIAKLDKQIGEDLAQYAKDVDALIKAEDTSDKQKEFLAVIAKEFAAYRKVSLDALDIKQGMLSNAASFMTVIETNFDTLKASFEKLQANEAEVSAQVVTDAKDLASANNKLLLTGCFLSASLALLFAWLSSSLIVRPLHEASELAHSMAKGDFTVRPDECSTDATGQVLTAMAEVASNMSQVVSEIRVAADQVDLASTEIAMGNLDLSKRTEETAAALIKTAASLEELTVTLRSSAQNAADANEMARQASQVADEGGHAVTEVVETMERIDSQAKKISEIIGVIDSIAFQTNILALNAAVEAARAGEQGRGFAVVAQEVRMLAKRSGDAAKEIRALIVASVEQAELGARKVQAAGEKMHRIVSSIRGVSATVEEISRVTAQQADGIGEVSVAVREVDRHTQQNAAMVEQASSAAESLKTQARLLAESIGTLRTS